MKKLLILIGLVGFTLTFAQDRKVEVDKKFKNITDVEINVVFSDVVIEQASGSGVHVTGSVTWSRDKDVYDIITRQSGTTLIVEVDHPRNSKGSASGQFYITMPAMTDADVNSVSGDIKVTGVGQRKVKCNTVSGDIVAHKIGSDVSANTVSGDIVLDGVKGSAKSNTVSGDAELLNIDGNLKGNSVSGSFRIVNLKGNREISTLSGSIR
ncbi:DUF4097 family beta strand repeat-containing protein [Carboxylicivirga marina]|uniref:DUF4097 family beta strand repeat protein n=1 Tax=Carboxylicivirga marina TaxID=2800988 RepID=A0ABS1HFE0_9BACT|nr:DUF4097 family beta strand repeat-containing protein [Carboxylicivirga marina]MBK3516363.1 DUF4097 family beta strand repeat protein [Carboxylicivirga marina]